MQEEKGVGERVQGRRKLSHSRGRRTGSAGREFCCKAREETKAPTAVTWLGRAESRELPVKTSRGKGKGFKGAAPRGDKIKFLQQGQRRESCSARDCRPGMIGFGKECGTPLTFSPLAAKASVGPAPIPPAQPAWTCFCQQPVPGGLRGAPTAAGVFASLLFLFFHPLFTLCSVPNPAEPWGCCQACKTP